MLRSLLTLIVLAVPSALPAADAGQEAADTGREAVDFDAIAGPIIRQGSFETAYRDPAAHYHDGLFRVFHTLHHREPDGHYYVYTAVTRSRDLVHWTESQILTPRDLSLNFSSPGNVVRVGDKWVLCLQTYPTPGDETFGTEDSRIWTMESTDLEHWSEPRRILVKGPQTPVEDMGRMIDPYLVRDKDRPDRWWCFFKQRGVSMSYSDDQMRTWTYHGRTDCGENVCVLTGDDRYVIFHSPQNGIGIKTSKDLKEFRDAGLLTLGQKDWPWAQGRLTAGHVLDLRGEPRVGRYLMFFHGDSAEGLKRHGAHGAGCLGLAWSDDLVGWHWGGQRDE
ncbi:MAG: sialidase family protein [Thermoguttaceae bacterium]